MHACSFMFVRVFTRTQIFHPHVIRFIFVAAFFAWKIAAISKQNERKASEQEQIINKHLLDIMYYFEYVVINSRRRNKTKRPYVCVNKLYSTRKTPQHICGAKRGGCAFSTRCTADKRSAGSMNRFKKTNTCTRPDIVHICSIVKRSWNSTAFYTIFAKTIKRRLCNLFDALNLFGCLRFFITRDGECWWHDRDTRRLELHYIAIQFGRELYD